VLGTSTHPDNAFVMQALRGVAGDSDIFRAGRFLICDRDPKWSGAVEELLRTVGVRVVRTPASAPNCNAQAERFIRSIKTECLDRVVPLGERHLRHLLREFIDHYRAERNHQGIGNELLSGHPTDARAVLCAVVSEWAASLSSTTGRRREHWLVREWDSMGSISTRLNNGRKKKRPRRSCRTAPQAQRDEPRHRHCAPLFVSEPPRFQ
jgi:hypothetical protein